MSTPKRVQLNRPDKRLLVEWPDGNTDEFPWAYLRANCPSASERTERERLEKNPLTLSTSTPSIEIVNVRLVGNYALNIQWSDGHSAGIYSWSLLRTLAEDDQVLHSKSISES